MAWYWIVLIVIGAIIIFFAGAIIAIKVNIDHAFKMIDSFFKGPGGKDE